MHTYDNSQLQQYKNCPESYRLKYVEQLKKRDLGRGEHDREFGSAVHKGLEVFYKGGTLVEMKDAFSKLYPLQLNEDDKAKTLDNGLVLLEDYEKHYRSEDSSLEVLAVEVADEFEIGDGFKFKVKLDTVVRKQGCIYSLEHKTTKKNFGWDYWGQFEPNSQITAQTAYIQARWGECSGVIVNGLSLGYRTRMYKGEPAGFHCEFQRQLFNRNREQVSSWKLDQIKWIKHLELAKQGTTQPWAKNEGQCRFCSYKEICVSCNDEQVTDQLFEKHDATAYLKE